jgi:hypothetical protein
MHRLHFLASFLRKSRKTGTLSSASPQVLASSTIVWRRASVPFALVVILFVPACCQAEETCLWLNAATAGGILDGAVTATVSRPNGSPVNTHPANAKSSAGPMNANPGAANYSKDGIDDADCVFARRAGTTLTEMRIEVRTMNDSRNELTAHLAHCGALPVPLKAIGTEALACSLDGKAEQHAEQVVGRVRDRVFLVRLSTNDASIGQAVLREKTRKTAEQVAGNLF